MTTGTGTSSPSQGATPRETDAEAEQSTSTRNGSSSSQGSSSQGGSSSQAVSKPDASGQGGSKQQAEDRPGLVDAAASLAGRFESAAAEKAESAVSGRGFATVLGWAAENLIAVTRIGGDIADLALRNLRLAGRKDIARIGAQQARTEDKLERLLQEVESLEAELRRMRGSA
jgi:hypothetical protein